MKTRYKIPFPITETKLNALTSFRITVPLVGIKIGPKAQIKIKDVLVVLVMFIGLAVTLFITPIASAFLPWGFLFLLAGVATIYVLGKQQDNGERGYMWVLPTINYWISYKERAAVVAKNRVLQTKKGNIKFVPELEALRNLYGLDAYNEDGEVHFTNGDFGRVYRVGGKMSLNNFQSDNTAIIDGLQALMNQWDQEVKVVIVTQLMRQRVADQQKSMTAYKKLSINRNQVMQKLIKNRLNNLELVHDQFMTSQQFLILRSASERKLNEAHQIWSSQVASYGALQSFELLNKTETLHALQNIYLGEQREFVNPAKLVPRSKKRVAV